MQYITVTKPISSIEEYAADQSLGGGDRVSGYGAIDGDKKIDFDRSKEKLVTIILTPERPITCLVDIDAMNLTEESDVKLVMVGNHVACILNEGDGCYAYFETALHNKYNRSRVMAGINMAVVSVVGGYVLFLVMQKLESGVGVWLASGGTVILFVGLLLYALYASFDKKHGHNKLRQYLKKILN